MTKEISGMKIEASPWSKGTARRTYFKVWAGQRNPAQCCWDHVARQWVKSHCEPGHAIKNIIVQEFNLLEGEAI